MWCIAAIFRYGITLPNLFGETCKYIVEYLMQTKCPLRCSDSLKKKKCVRDFGTQSTKGTCC